ncbi:cellulose biosynthesis cyclic di-GMP-binding regulatory protein BcsB [Gloeocapsopsis sp. IPPAS B-1203]|uniref:cellulose biosynthesis cyclic di-GMP-binding regulatory protein BcsB n=1 Tax=Gloeocapsopsis sp. IPPAS B-1203 TaxID=2049454 RepID=UPI000C1A014C|nr:cellulose biosynthesis cyclic di-GMP-binding regulatory protein BcsB [Gloeocapsopsis sp. IPPAS B-1203]PIG94044.1 cellulose synthase [Gloeocapsopsis sp. IPPAS B-1203]
MHSFRRDRPTHSKTKTKSQTHNVLSPYLWLVVLGCTTAVLASTTTSIQAQSENRLRQEEQQLIQEYALPKAPSRPPVYRPQQRVTAPATAPRRSRSSQPQRGAQQPAPQAPSRPPATARSVPPRPQPAATATTPRSRPESSPKATTVAANAVPPSQYVMEFNRSPVVGNRFRLQGIYSEGRLGFTRPRGWQVQSVKALIRFQHSPALFANRSNLTLRVNGTSVGSVPLNRKQSQIGSVLFDIPPNLIQNFNELTVVAQQHNSATCSEADQTLWTEILPDSKLIFNYTPQPVPINLSRYPYPFFDELSLEPNQIAYLLPQQMSETWLTAAARFQTSLGRLAEFRPIDTSLVESVDAVGGQRLVIIGTPEEQPALRELDLPFAIAGNQVLDGNQDPLPEDVGVLMVTTTKESGVPVLVATGNGSDGVTKAVQALVQSQNRKIATGQGMIVSQVTEAPTPGLRQWPRYLPENNSFALKDLATSNNQPFEDVTVRGSAAPPIEFDFRALPSDRFNRGNSMTLRYSYGPQVNPRTSAVEVLLDGVFIGGERLTSEQGEVRKTLNVNLPENLITPTSKIQVAFRLHSKEAPDRCGGVVADQQLSGTVHADTSFRLNRETSVQIPDLKLLQAGFPFTAPQDLSSTAIVLPDAPSQTDLLTMLEFSERMGRLSQAESVALQVYTAESFPMQEQGNHHLVGIGTREQFPFPEVFQAGSFFLSDVFSRSWGGGTVQALPDEDGVIKQIISPWNRDRVVLALSAQTDNGLERVRQILDKDPWFFQLQKDTVLISSNQQDPAAYDPEGYELKFLQSSPQRRIENTSLLSKASRLLQEHWYLLPLGILGIAVVLYGITQAYLKRITVEDKK